jgi:hypothetical protein
MVTTSQDYKNVKPFIIGGYPLMRSKISISISNIAVIFLEASLVHFNNKQFIIALHVAGPADELLGSILKQRNTPTALDDTTSYLSKVHESFGRPVSDKFIRDTLNLPKIKNKHVDHPVDSMSRAADWELEAEQMILRAIRNYEKVFYDLPNSDAFNTFVSDSEFSFK